MKPFQFRKLLPSSVRSRLGVPINTSFMGQAEDVAKHIDNVLGYSGDLLPIYAENKEGIVNKYHHYLPIYDQYFSRYRGTKVKMLEIGVAKGGSLAMWRKYLGEQAILYGIDIDPDCLKFNNQYGQVRIGSQDDKYFLQRVIHEMGGVDVVLNDGSHLMKHIKSSLNILYPLLEFGGTYFIEDLQTCYWRGWGGGYDSRNNFFSLVGELINDMHHWYHDNSVKHPKIGLEIGGIHIHDAVVVIQKSKTLPPISSRVGLE